MQLPEPEADGVHSASTNRGDADGVQFTEPEADGVQASGMVIQSTPVCCRTTNSTCFSLLFSLLFSYISSLFFTLLCFRTSYSTIFK